MLVPYAFSMSCSRSCTFLQSSSARGKLFPTFMKRAAILLLRRNPAARRFKPNKTQASTAAATEQRRYRSRRRSWSPHHKHWSPAAAPQQKRFPRGHQCHVPLLPKQVREPSCLPTQAAHSSMALLPAEASVLLNRGTTLVLQNGRKTEVGEAYWKFANLNKLNGSTRELWSCGCAKT